MEQATRDNKNKLDYTILPWEAVTEVVRVFEYGASKYTRDNYKKGDGLPLPFYHQSAMRHLVASINGEELDPESGLDHLALLAANCLMGLWQKQHEAKKALTLGATLTPFGESLKLLRDLVDMQNGAPLETYRKEWEETVKEIYGFLWKWEEQHKE